MDDRSASPTAARGPGRITTGTRARFRLAIGGCLAALSGPPGNRLCIFISQTEDPIAGGWFEYSFNATDFPDFPRYAVWPDAYYATTNEVEGTVYALDREQMLAGSAAGMQRFTLPDLDGFGFQALTPTDLDGDNLPPVGAPAWFVRHRDDEAHEPTTNDPVADFLEIWAFSVDWETPADSTFAQVQDLELSEFSSDLCGLLSSSCFPQPDSEVLLEPWREVVMWRSVYRNFGTHQALVGSFVTDVDGTDHGGVRWFELRKVGKVPWSLFQEEVGSKIPTGSPGPGPPLHVPAEYRGQIPWIRGTPGRRCG